LVLGYYSWNKFEKNLPGSFSISHKRWGYWIFRGVVVTALSGNLIYILVFAT